MLQLLRTHRLLHNCRFHMLVAVALAAVGNVGAIGSLAVDTVYDMINSHVHRPVLHRVFVLAQLERRDDLVLQFARAFAFPTTAASADAVDYSLAGLLLVPLGFYDAALPGSNPRHDPAPAPPPAALTTHARYPRPQGPFDSLTTCGKSA